MDDVTRAGASRGSRGSVCLPQGGKESRKAGIAATLAIPMDLEMVVRRMRRLVADINGTNTLALPSMDREMRKSVHELHMRSNSRERVKEQVLCVSRP
jgi:hypothetical protein